MKIYRNHLNLFGNSHQPFFSTHLNLNIKEDDTALLLFNRNIYIQVLRNNFNNVPFKSQHFLISLILIFQCVAHLASFILKKP